MNAASRPNRIGEIPKIIHQTFFASLNTPSNVTEKIIRNIHALKTLNPGWEHRLYDDAEMLTFVQKNFEPAVFKRFNLINPHYGAARVDLFRYLLMYRVGGIYLDIKSRATIALDSVIKPDDRYLLSQWKNDDGGRYAEWGLHPELKEVPHGEFQQWHIVSSPGHPYLKAVIDKVLNNIDRYNPGLHGVGRKGVLRLTGPIAYTQAIFPILKEHPHRIVDSQNDLGFEYSIFFQGGGHYSLFPNHYSSLTDSIIKMSTIRKISSRIVHMSIRGPQKIKELTLSALRRD